MVIPAKWIFVVCALKGSVVGLPLTTRRHSRRLRKYIKISAPQKRKFYSQINFFICEITSRLLRDKNFYLVVEFFLLPRELRLLPRNFIFIRMRIIFHPHENLFSSHQTVSPFASEIFPIASDCKSGRVRNFSDRIRLQVRSHRNFLWSHQTASPVASEFFLIHKNKITCFEVLFPKHVITFPRIGNILSSPW